MTKAMMVYKELERYLGVEKNLGRGMSKREYVDGGCTYTCFFLNGALTKVEAYNGSSLVELWNK